MAHKYLVDDDFEFVSIYSGQNNKDEKFIDSLATQARSEIQFCENDIQDGFTKEFLDIFSFKEQDNQQIIIEPKQQIIDTLGNNLNEDPEPEFSIAEMKKIAKKITEQQMQTIEDELDEDEQCDQYVEQKDQFNQPNTIHSQPKQSLSHKQNKMSLTEELALMRANISKDIDDEYAEVERLRLEAEEKQR
ncbi:MAG: hypothetical protein EZS28_001915 [Streblomastix strix]|uniref:Uncharacterized protein n=1 Tax=Streblomastix strix TaxID=222440 RepID=A0A5J4X5Q7_9EUKA|nr:MAG: hypothetical protein EZS28_001915 [Streblomastix strix]